MKLKKVMASAMIVGALGFGAVGLGSGFASASPGAPAPLDPGFNNPWPWPPGPGRDDHGRDWYRADDRGGDWAKSAWWATNRHDWWDDRNGPPPWGWGPPPPAQWDGPPPWVNPHPINYWGYNENPVWDDNFHSWGIWLLGQWIPLIGFST